MSVGMATTTTDIPPGVNHPKGQEPQRVKCAIPDCSILVSPPEPGQPPLCKEHGEAFKVFRWAIQFVKFNNVPPPPPQIAVPRLVTPGGIPLR